MGLDSFSLSLDHVGGESCHMCNQSCSHRKVVWLDEQIPPRSSDVTAALTHSSTTFSDFPQHDS